MLPRLVSNAWAQVILPIFPCAGTTGLSHSTWPLFFFSAKFVMVKNTITTSTDWCQSTDSCWGISSFTHRAVFCFHCSGVCFRIISANTQTMIKKTTCYYDENSFDLIGSTGYILWNTTLYYATNSLHLEVNLFIKIPSNNKVLILKEWMFQQKNIGNKGK